MTIIILPLANWGAGTILIAIFAVVCIVLTALVLSFIFGGKKKKEDEMNSSENENL
ncbi:hypothetical protein QRD02_07225 [Aequorivita sp. SDUM287046]|uniref:Uncharacterized protein n=1 Tax=Aequorivita aurantiaca TaxID=3053356 RepID=A0ABT8DHH6_9FLAO|nr:hypothetical protein [Aequorivita aurantiaca]MDN3724169.1 hypothetical protein [Aequorivita aurantiaca]